MNKKNDTWMPLYIGDYLADTSRLSTEQHGAYLLILMDYWRNGPPLDEDEELASITKLSAAQWRKHAAKIRALFTPEGGRLTQKRANAERAKAGLVSAERSVAGKKGAEARWGKKDSKPDSKADGKQMANAMAKPSQTDGPSQSQSEYRADTPPEDPPTPAHAPTHVPACEAQGQVPQPEEAPAPPEPPAPLAQGTPYGAITRRLMDRGIGRANPGHIEFRQLVDAGASFEEFDAYVPKALAADDPWSYLITTVRNERKRAKFQAAQLHQGPMPARQQIAQPQSFRQQDREANMRRWEEATGRVHPDREQQHRGHDPRPFDHNVIDMESPAPPALEHDHD